MGTHLISHFFEFHRSYPVSCPQTYPLIVEFVIVEHHDGLDEVPFLAAWYDS